MTMMITKFNKLIQNKVMWFLFSLVVVVSFVLWDTTLPDAGDLAAQQSAGEFNGEPIKPEVLQQHRFNTYLSVVQQVGQPISYREIQDELEPMIHRRMAGLDAAADLDLIASDAEVKAGLAQQPAFQENGQFNKARYSAYIREGIGRSLGVPITENGFEEHVREEISLRKLQNMLQQTVLLPPYELKRRYRIYNDIYSADVAIIRADAVSKGVSTSGDEAKVFFEEDPARFTIPPKRTVKYVALPVKDFVTTNDVTQSMVEDFYERYQDRYLIASTNDTSPEATNDVAESTNEFQLGETDVAYQPLEEVEDEIRTELELESARFHASSAAMKLLDDLETDRDGNALDIEEAAAKHGMEIQTAGPFTEDDTASDFGSLGREVVEQTWLLTSEENENYSNPIEDKESDHVYVIVLDEELPSRVPEYDEVKNQVLVAANRQKIADTVTESAKALATEIEELGAEATNTLADVARGKGYEAFTFESVNLATGLVDNAYADAIVNTLVSLSPGQVSEPVPVQDGQLIAIVRDQEQADDVEFDNYRTQIAPTFTRQITSMVFPEWQDQLLQNGNFSLRTFEDEAEDAEDTIESDDEATTS